MTDQVDGIAAAQGAGADLQHALGQLGMYGVTIAYDRFARVVIYATASDTCRLTDVLTARSTEPR